MRTLSTYTLPKFVYVKCPRLDELVPCERSISGSLAWNYNEQSVRPEACPEPDEGSFAKAKRLACPEERSIAKGRAPVGTRHALRDALFERSSARTVLFLHE